MMRILIADDERMVRFSVQSMVEELYPGRFSFEHAENGRVLLDKAAGFTPHIGFVDIQMPLMSGLEALEECIRLSPRTVWVILSGFATFEYAKTALRLGAREYLLKPPSLEDLQATVDNALESCAAWAREENERFSLAVMRRFTHYEIAPEEPGAAQPGNCEMFLFYADQQRHEARQQALATLTGALQRALDARLGEAEGFRYALFYLAGGELCLVAEHGSEMQSLREAVAPLLPGGQVTALRTAAQGLDALCAEGAGLRRTAALRMLRGYGSLVDAQSPAWQELAAKALPAAHKLEEVCLAFVQRDELAYKNRLEELEALCSPEVWQVVDAAAVGAYLGAVLGSAPKAGTPQELTGQLARLAADMYRAQAAGTADLAGEVKRFVQAHYAEPIGVATIAELYDISPNYLSRIFHEKSGMKFIDYLTEVRIANAKRLFTENSGITVKAVSEQVGYFGTRHFTKTFQRLTGVLPSEYADSL